MFFGSKRRRYCRIYASLDWLARIWPSSVHMDGVLLDESGNDMKKAAAATGLPWGILTRESERVCLGATFTNERDARRSKLPIPGYNIWATFEARSMGLADAIHRQLISRGAELLREDSGSEGQSRSS